MVMGRRRDTARFRPGVYVFPGGRLEQADFRVKPATPLAEHITTQCGAAPSRACALALAAVRETYEESGLLLASPGDPGPTGNASWEALRARGLAPALDRLCYLGRAITPPTQHIRFHARFFAVDARHVQGELGGDSELEDLRWVPLEDVPALEVMPVTLLMIESLQRKLTVPADDRTAYLRFQRGVRTISWI